MIRVRLETAFRERGKSGLPLEQRRPRTLLRAGRPRLKAGGPVDRLRPLFENQSAKEIDIMAMAAKTTAFLKAKPGKAAELESLLRNLASQSRSEPGNLRWDLWQDLDDHTTFVVDELYRDAASVQAHHATPHFQNYASRINDLATRVAVTSRPLDIA